MLLLCMILLGAIQGLEGYNVDTPPYDTSAVIGGNATLACVVSNRNGETVKWYSMNSSSPNTALSINNSPVDNSGHYAISGSYNLSVVKVKLADQGCYKCSIFPSGSGQSTDYFGYLTVVDLPRNLSLSWNWRPQTPGPNNLTCRSSRAHPPPSLTWFKNGQPLDAFRAVYTHTNDSSGYGEATSTLGVSLSSSDEGALFSCQASYDDMSNATAAYITASFNAASPLAASSRLLLLLLPVLLAHLS